jgi:hypothetical protein
MLKRKPRVVEWNSCIDVPLSRGVLGMFYKTVDHLSNKMIKIWLNFLSSSRPAFGSLHKTSREERNSSR